MKVTHKSLRRRATPDPATAPTAMVTEDVDVYDAPGGGGTVVDTLRQGQPVPFGGCNADNWCNVTGIGWVWGDFLVAN